MTESLEASFIKLAVARGLLTQDLAKQLYSEAREQKRPIDDLLVERGILTSYNLEVLHREHSKAQAPRVIGGCEIIAKLGQGGMGAVYRAVQLSIGREVALKVLAPDVARKPGFAERFLREGKAMGAINHPNVITCFDAGHDGKILYMALELMTGGDADQAARRQGGRLPPLRACEIIRDCAAGLGAIAKAGLIHRDIKPANIFLGEGGIAKLADLGLARHEDGEDQMTRTGTAMGTPAYMSPEQAQGEEIDIRSDIYALGATLFALVTGQPPFSGSSAFAIVAKVINDPVPDPRTLIPELSEPIVALIRHAMQKDRRKRPQTPSDLQRDLNACIDHLRHTGTGLTASPTIGTFNHLAHVTPESAVTGSGFSGRRTRVQESTTIAVPRTWLILGIALMIGLIATLALFVVQRTTNHEPIAAQPAPVAATPAPAPAPAPLPAPVTSAVPPPANINDLAPKADGSWPRWSEWYWRVKMMSAHDQLAAVTVALEKLHKLSDLEIGNHPEVAGKKIRELILPGAGITDLRPLTAIKSLQNLTITGGSIDYPLPLWDLSPFEDNLFELFTLHIPFALINDLSPLAKKKLADADFAGCPIRDLRPILREDLRRLTFNLKTVDTGIEELRKLPGVTHIGSTWPDLMTAKEFWVMYDNGNYPGSRPGKIEVAKTNPPVTPTPPPASTGIIIPVPQIREPLFDSSPWILTTPKLAPYKIQQVAKKFNEFTDENWKNLLQKRRDLSRKTVEVLEQDLKREQAANFKDATQQPIIAALTVALNNLKIGASPKDPAFASKLLPKNSAQACEMWRNECRQSDSEVIAKVEVQRLKILAEFNTIASDRSPLLNEIVKQLEAMAPPKAGDQAPRDSK